MRLFEMLKGYLDSVILEAVLKVYPDQKGNLQGYQKALRFLRNMTHVTPDFYIIVEHREDEFAEEGEPTHYVDVSGISDASLDEAEEEGHSGILALDSTEWQEWLGAEVWNFVDLNEPELLAHILYEMTFHGYSPEAPGKFMDMLNDSKPEDYIPLN